MELIRAKDGGVNDQKVGFYKLFSYADRIDVVLMIVGSIGAIANGASQPISTLAFSQLVNSLGQPNHTQLLHQVSKACIDLSFVLLYVCIYVCVFMIVWFCRQLLRFYSWLLVEELQGFYVSSFLVLYLFAIN